MRTSRGLRHNNPTYTKVKLTTREFPRISRKSIRSVASERNFLKQLATPIGLHFEQRKKKEEKKKRNGDEAEATSNKDIATKCARQTMTCLG